MSDEFEKDIMHEERILENNWALVLENDDDNIIEEVVMKLMEIVDMDERKARVVAVYVHLIGKAVIAKGTLRYINQLSDSFSESNLKTYVMNLHQTYNGGK